MRKLKHIWQWIRRELFFDLNRVYKDNYRKPPRNRHERRRQAKEERCWISEFFRGLPIYKFTEYREAFQALASQKYKEWKHKNNIK